MSAPHWLAPPPEGTAFTKLLTVYSAAGVIALVAWVLNVGQLYWMAGILALLPQASRLVAALEQRGLTVTRTVPAAGHQGDEVRVRLTAANHFPLPKLHLSVLDVLPKGLTATPAEPLPVHLPPRGEDTVEYSLRLGRRGWHQLDGVHVLGTDPIGLAHRESRHTLPVRVLVYPRVVRLPDHVLPPHAGGGSAPVTEAGRQGEGTSFFGIREYRPGDPLRHVHWRTAARIGKLTVVEWEAEESHDTVLAIETAAAAERDLGAGTTLDLAAGLAASLAAQLLPAQHAVRLIAPGTTEWEPAGHRGGAAIQKMLEDLARMQPVPTGGLRQEMRRLAPHLTPGTTLCWITSDLGDGLEADCRYLLAVRMRPVVYALFAGPGELPGVLSRLQTAGVTVIPIKADDELTHALLN